ncbi:MAG: 50S ribosomal protein L24 [Candidatus Paceibacterota bacterium]|jgi:large subunit ribosomal protein L24
MIKKNDMVMVIAGKDKGVKAKVLVVLTKKNQVLVEGVNMKKHHQRPTRSGQKGQMVEKSLPIHISNVQLMEGGKPVRASKKLVAGRFVRVSRKTGKEI